MASLLDKSLLREEGRAGGEPRLGMLETIREYGLECLAASGEDVVIPRALRAAIRDIPVYAPISLLEGSSSGTPSPPTGSGMESRPPSPQPPQSGNNTTPENIG